MCEIAATFESHDLPAGFHLAAAEIYRRLEHFKDSEPDAARVFKALADS